MGINDDKGTKMSEQSSTSRRTILSGAVAGFALTASGLFLPETRKEADARDGALGGTKGGRHEKNHRGHDKHKRRDHGDKKGEENDNLPQSGGKYFRDVALLVHNMRSAPVQVQGWQLHFTGPNPGGAYYFKDSSWNWSTIDAKPANGHENVMNFFGSEWTVVVRIGTDRVVAASNNMIGYPSGSILSGGWDATHGWNPLGDTLANDEKMHVDDSIMAGGIRLQRTIDSDSHIQFYVWLT
jgi:hypothetical protein